MSDIFHVAYLIRHEGHVLLVANRQRNINGPKQQGLLYILLSKLSIKGDRS